MNFKSDQPYPLPRVIKKNLQYAKMLLQEYSGESSENTVTHLYLYQSFILKTLYPEIAHILQSIAITEMKHLSLLGQTITLLGMKPIYATMDHNHINYWTGKEVNYSTSLRQILETDIQSETKTIQNYQQAIESIQDPHIQRLLARIIDDEKIHLQVFQNLYKTNF